MSVLERAETSQSSCFAPLAMFYAYHSSIRAREVAQNALPFLLFRRGHIKPIMKSDRQRAGGIWSHQQASSGAHRILGAYDCQSSTLYFDAYAGPTDVQAILTHEISHFMRDKFSSSQDLGLNIREFVLVDEVLASMSAAHFEIIDSTRDPLEFDVTLYNPSGSFVSMGRERNEYGSRRVLWAPFDDFRGYLEHAVLPEASGELAVRSLGVIEEAYFLSPSIDLSRLVQKMRTSPISRLAPELSYGTEALSAANRASVINVLNSGPSAACREFSASAANGFLDDYLGTRIPSPSIRPGGEGVKPGGEGVKPNVSTLRPCLHPGAGF